MKAQIFDVAEDGRLTRVVPPHDVGADVVVVLGQFPDAVPPPTLDDLT